MYTNIFKVAFLEQMIFRDIIISIVHVIINKYKKTQFRNTFHIFMWLLQQIMDSFKTHYKDS